MNSPTLLLSDPVAEALRSGGPVVALESTIISHGLPRPRNLEAAQEFEAILTEMGVTPATIAVLDGMPRVGLDSDGVRRIADEDMTKASIRDLPILAARGGSGATTVAATTRLAALAGVRVFATGGLGGDPSRRIRDVRRVGRPAGPRHLPHRRRLGRSQVRARRRRPPSSDSRRSACPSSATAPTVFPRFWLSESDLALDWRVDSPEEVAAILRAQDAAAGPDAPRIGRPGMVVANPVPLAQQWDPAEHDRVLLEAFAAAAAAGVRGKAVTPFLLGFIVNASKGVSLEVNLDLARNNVRLAGEIALALAA